MRWLPRDVGVFLYGCLFAGKYIYAGYFGRLSRQLEAQGARTVPDMRSQTIKPKPTPLKPATALL
jgi:hypothetical protein